MSSADSNIEIESETETPPKKEDVIQSEWIIPNDKGARGCPNWDNCKGMGNTRNFKDGTITSKKTYVGHTTNEHCPYRIFSEVN